MSSLVKFQTSVTIRGRTYRTAKHAAEAYGLAVLSRFEDKHTKKIGHAAYHDQKWFQRHYGGNTVKSGFLEFLEGLPPTAERAARRSLPIFKRYLK